MSDKEKPEAEEATETETDAPEDAASGFATTTGEVGFPDETEDELAEALEEEAGEDDEDESVMEIIDGAHSLLDEGLMAAAGVVGGLAEDAELEGPDETDTPDTSTARSVLEKFKHDLESKLAEFSDEVLGLDYSHDPRDVMVEVAEGSTAKGEKVSVVHNKARTAIQLRVGKKRIAEDQVVSVLRRLVMSGQVSLDTLTLSFVPQTADEQGDDVPTVTLSAGDPPSCKALMSSAMPLPVAWVWRDVESLCEEVASSIGLAQELVDSNLTLVSGGVRCISKDGDNVVGLQRWIFQDGVIHSVRWDDGGERSATETVRLLTAVEMLADMYEKRQQGWTDFQLLPNLDAIATTRREVHTDEHGKLKPKFRAMPHSFDTAIIYESDIEEPNEDGTVPVITNVNELWTKVREHAGAAFEEHLQGPVETLVGYKDLIDKTLSESVDQLLGIAKTDFLVKTAEQFQAAEPDPIEEEEDDEPEDEPDFDEPIKGKLGEDSGMSVLEEFNRRREAGPAEAAKTRGKTRRKQSGSVRRSRF